MAHATPGFGPATILLRSEDRMGDNEIVERFPSLSKEYVEEVGQSVIFTKGV